jgi:hypothetical protein
MSERKQTPDVLADILGAGSVPPASVPTSTKTPRPAARNRPSPAEPAARPRAADKVRRWEYAVVSCQEYRGWRPRYENGVELAGWAHGPLLQSYLEEQGLEGWELVAATSGRPMFGVTDCYQLFFKRPVE